MSHFVRISETAQAIDGEYFQSGRWIADGSVTEHLIDPTLGEEVSAGEAEEIEASLMDEGPSAADEVDRRQVGRAHRSVTWTS